MSRLQPMTDPVGQEYFRTAEVGERTFQEFSLERSIYHVPVDEEEENRLMLEDEIFSKVFDERLFFPDIKSPKNILDCGYGRASWAVKVAERYEDCRVTAVDIYPAELPDQPDNLECEIHNLNEPLYPVYGGIRFDLVHSRCVAPGIKLDRWQPYINDLARLVRRGGYLQCSELYYNIQSDSGRLTDEHSTYHWYQYYQAGAQQLNRDPRVGRKLHTMFRNARLVDVQQRHFRIPIGEWPHDEQQKGIGMANRENVKLLVESHAVWMFTHTLGWNAEQFQWFINKIRGELDQDNLKLYIEL